MPTYTDKEQDQQFSYWLRLFNTRYFYGPMLDQAAHEMYRWAKRQRMQTGVRRPGLRVNSAINGELAIKDNEDREAEPPLPSVVVVDPAILELMDEHDPDLERRRDLRVPLRRTIRFSDGDRFETGEIINISATGLLIAVTPTIARPRERGTLIAGAFHPDATGLRQAVGFKGRIVRRVVKPEGDRIGVEFTRMVEAHRHEIHRIIDRTARKHRRRDPTLRGWKASG
jgi:hypothetical protein